MIASRHNVFTAETAPQQSFGAGIFGRVRNDDYRVAVSRIVLEVEAEFDWDDERLAEELGCSKGTVKNARLKKGNLDAVTMLNLGSLPGGQARLKPILALVSGPPAAEPSILDEIAEAHRRLDAAEQKIRERAL